MDFITVSFDYLNSMDATVPAPQIMIMLLVTTLILLFGKVRIALLTNYLFAFHWGYFVNREAFQSQVESGDSIFLFVYISFGIAVAILAGIGLLVQKD